MEALVNDPVAILKRDHREVEAMLKTLANSSRPTDRRRKTVDKLVAALSLHMEIEEADVYPVVARELGAEEVDEAENEHKLARDGLAQLRSLVDKPGFGAAVAMLTAGIKHHVKEEETEIFPRLKKHLERDELSRLGDQVAAAKQAGAQRRPRTRVA
jgi:hemerythrin superfamily protein